MKKIIKFIIGLVLSIILLLIIALIIISFLLFDNSNKGTKTDDTIEDSISYLNYNALETAKDDKLSYTFDVITLNSLLGSISNSINLDPVKIMNMYTTYDNLDDDIDTNDTITLYVPLKLYFYETCLIATMNITKNDDSFTLVITDAKIGKVNSNFFLIKSTLEKSFDPSIVEKELSKQGFNTDCDYKDGKFYIDIKTSDLFDFIMKYLDNNPLYKAIIDVIKENKDLYDINFSGKEKGFIINLNTLSSTILNDKSFENNSNPEANAIKKAEKLLENKIINNEQAPYVVDYLVRGYNSLNDEEKNKIKDIDMSSIGISNVQSYAGIVKRNNVDLVAVIASSLIGFNPLIPNTFNVQLTDSDINAIIDDQEIIGKTFTFIKNNSINYITIGNIYITSSYHKLLLTLVLDLNGKEIKMDFSLDASNVENGYIINTTLVKSQIGSINLNNDEQTSLLEYLENNIDSDLLKIDSKTKAVTLDFESYFNDSSLILLSIAENHLNKQIEIKDGYVEVRLTVTL